MFLDNWEHLTSDRAVLQNVEGVRLEFDQIPVQTVLPRPYVCNQIQTDVIDTEVLDLLSKGVILEVENNGELFVSNIFLRPKPNNKWRLIIDLSELNRYITKHHFKMENLEVATRLMFTDAFLASIDLRDAYYAIPIHPKDRKFLCFQWKDKFFQFTCLPFGLCSAPWLFTKTLKPIFAEFHKKGFSGFGYIDDTFIVASSEQECYDAIEFLVNLFSKLGFRVHPEKSVLVPTKQLVFLGYVLDTEQMSVTPTQEKKEKISSMVTKAMSKDKHKIREIASLIGTLNDVCKGSEYGHAQVKSLEIQKNRALFSSGSKGFDGNMLLNSYCKEELVWWIRNINSAKKAIRISPPELVLETDASNLGWGAKFDDVSTGGRWSELESQAHINAKEILAVKLGLQSLCADISHEEIVIRSDNTTTVAYLNHGGGTKSTVCNKFTKQIWDWCEHRNLWILATFIPGIQNEVADFESRHFSEDTEWKLNPELFDKITTEWGVPNIDLFASRHNNQVDNYASWVPDPHALFVNAFSEKWDKFTYVYAFPPFRLLTRILQKIKKEKVRAIMVAPDWPGQPWFAPLQKQATQILWFRKKRGNLISDIQMSNQQGSLDSIPLMVVLIC